MTGRAVRRRLGLTPLIDVIFLLVLFFMLSSTLARFGEVPLGRTTATGSGTGQPPAALFLQLGAQDLRLNGRPTKLRDLPAALARAQASRPATAVWVSVRAEATAQQLADLLVALRRSAPNLAVTLLEPS